MPLPAFSFSRSPLVTTTIQAIFINSCANIIAQFLESHKATSAHVGNLKDAPTVSVPTEFHLDVIRVLYFGIWTVLSVPPNFRWQQFLERRFPAYYAEEKTVKREADDEGVPFVVKKKKRNFKHTVLKILCDQGCMAPFNCLMFLSVMTLLKGGGLWDAFQTVHDKFWRLKFAGWKIWPLVGLVNFTFVPVDRRIIVSTSVGLCWNIFLALFIS